MSSDLELSDEIHAIVSELLGGGSQDRLNPMLPRLDTSKPNEHDTKKEFLAEKKFVLAAISHANALVETFFSKDNSGAFHAENPLLAQSIDSFLRRDAPKQSINVPSDLILTNMAMTGFVTNFTLSLLDFLRALRARNVQLADQEREFWSLSHRAPNYHARTIALRVARLYGQKWGKKPTFGTSSEGGHPSTQFGKAIERIFEILGLNCDIRGPIEWAIDQMTDEDLRPHSTGILGGFLGHSDPERSSQAIVDALRQNTKNSN